MTNPSILVIGCGNLLRGDDAAGPSLVRRLGDRGLPESVRSVDGGTGGIDVVLQMRGVPEVILIDACCSGSEPGSLFEIPPAEFENLPPPAGLDLHASRWDHAVALARSLPGVDHPRTVTAYLIEGERFEVGEGLSPAVDRAVDRLADLLVARFIGCETSEAASP